MTRLVPFEDEKQVVVEDKTVPCKYLLHTSSSLSIKQGSKNGSHNVRREDLSYLMGETCKFHTKHHMFCCFSITNPNKNKATNKKMKFFNVSYM